MIMSINKKSLIAAVLSVSLFTGASLFAQDMSQLKQLFHLSPETASMVTANGSSAPDVTITPQDGTTIVTVKPNPTSGFPGILIKPAEPMDASGYGHVEATVTNLGTKPIRVNMRIDNEGPHQENRNNATVVGIKPGETKVLSVIPGYSYGKPAYKLDPKAVSQILIFAGKSDVEQKFRVEKIQAAGPEGETPFIDPATTAVMPEGGVLLGDSIKPIEATQVVAREGAKATVANGGRSFSAQFAAGKESNVLFRPVQGMWNLNRTLQVRVKVKNTGSSPVTPSVQLVSRGKNGGMGDVWTAGSPISPGAEVEIVAPFKAKVPWVGLDLPIMRDGLATKEEYQKAIQAAKGGGTPGTGTNFTSHQATGVLISANPSQAATLEVTSIVADMPQQPKLPDWLGKRPPVEGDWKKTFDENFDGDTIDLNTWNMYSSGEWHIGSQTAYSKDNTIVKDGKLTLRVEKRKTHHNDSTDFKQYEYVTGNTDTFGKWTQRYGYFEARVKLADAPNMFPAFWMMPDRGKNWKPTEKGDDKATQRNDTKDGGMEFDIMEQLSIWGPYRVD